jgi:tetratricopeptide (TPR) repeat protein
LRYHDEGLFLRVFASLDRVPPEDVRVDKQRAAWGNVYLSVSETPSIQNKPEYAGLALQFFESVKEPNNFLLQQKGHALYVLSRFDDARRVLEPLVTEDPNPWNRYWLSKVIARSGEFDRAIALIDEALNDPRAVNFNAALFEQRFDMRSARGDANSIEDLQMAYQTCVDSKHRGALGNKLAALQSKEHEK